MCVMPDRTLSCVWGGRAAAVIIRHRVPPANKDCEGNRRCDGGMDDQEVFPPVLSQHQLELCLQCPKALASHLAVRYGARVGGPKYYAVNLVLRLFLYHFLNTMSS
jgi:hypothetical protein